MAVFLSKMQISAFLESPCVSGVNASAPGPPTPASRPSAWGAGPRAEMIHFDPPWPQNDPEWRPGGKGSAAGGLARAVEPENGLKSSLGGAEKLV